MKYTQHNTVRASVADEAVVFDVHPDCRSCSVSVALADGASGWGTTVITVEVSVDGRFWRTARTYLNAAVATYTANAITQRIDLRSARKIRARVSTVGPSGSIMLVSVTQTSHQPSDKYA